MADNKLKLTLEGHRPLSSFRGRSGVAVKYNDTMTAAEWLLHLMEALDALYRHEARKIACLTDNEIPVAIPVGVGDVAEGEALPEREPKVHGVNIANWEKE